MTKPTTSPLHPSTSPPTAPPPPPPTHTHTNLNFETIAFTLVLLIFFFGLNWVMDFLSFFFFVKVIFPLTHPHIKNPVVAPLSNVEGRISHVGRVKRNNTFAHAHKMHEFTPPRICAVSCGHIEGWAQDWLKSDGCFSPNPISSPWRRYEYYNISFCKQWKFRCHCSYEQWHLNLHCLQRGPSCP